MQYAKAYAALIGSICTALLGTFTADSALGKVLTVVSVIATAVATFSVTNAPKPKDERGAVSVATIAIVAIAVVLVLSWLGVHGHVG